MARGVETTGSRRRQNREVVAAREFKARQYPLFPFWWVPANPWHRECALRVLKSLGFHKPRGGDGIVAKEPRQAAKLPGLNIGDAEGGGLAQR